VVAGPSSTWLDARIPDKWTNAYNIGVTPLLIHSATVPKRWIPPTQLHSPHATYACLPGTYPPSALATRKGCTSTAALAKSADLPLTERKIALRRLNRRKRLEHVVAKSSSVVIRI
jgi:hypothetical protein